MKNEESTTLLKLASEFDHTLSHLKTVIPEVADSLIRYIPRSQYANNSLPLDLFESLIAFLHFLPTALASFAQQQENEYCNLEEYIQKQETEIRHHIATQQQLQLYVQSLKSQITELKSRFQAGGAKRLKTQHDSGIRNRPPSRQADHAEKSSHVMNRIAKTQLMNTGQHISNNKIKIIAHNSNAQERVTIHPHECAHTEYSSSKKKRNSASEKKSKKYIRFFSNCTLVGCMNSLSGQRKEQQKTNSHKRNPKKSKSRKRPNPRKNQNKSVTSMNL